jgi:hypothetical protein
MESSNIFLKNKNKNNNNNKEYASMLMATKSRCAGDG